MICPSCGANSSDEEAWATHIRECDFGISTKIEPHSDVREMAATQRQMYEAYLEVGFTSKESVRLIGYWIRGGMS